MKLLILADSCSLPLFTNSTNGIGELCSPTHCLETYFNEDIYLKTQSIRGLCLSLIFFSCLSTFKY